MMSFRPLPAAGGRRAISRHPRLRRAVIFFTVMTASSLLANVRDGVVCSPVAGKEELDSLRAAAKALWSENPLDSEIQMAWARLMKSADSARGMYRKIIANPKAAPALQAEANFRLACISFMAANYAKAETYCMEAWKLDDREAYGRLYNRALILAGHDSLHSSADSAKRTDAINKKGEKKAAAPAYYLQIAAFSELENAQNLKKDLLRLFPNVVTMESSSHGKTVYRVRIGPFSGNNEAQAFGDSALIKSKISFRVVEDEREKSAP
jgi:hypothetical protein